VLGNPTATVRILHVRMELPFTVSPVTGFPATVKPNLTTLAASPYDVGMFIPGTQSNGALLAQVVLMCAVSFADDFAGARAYARVSATAATVLDVHRNGSPIGTITFGTGASAGTFATGGSGAEIFAAGDGLAIINEDPADATLADLSITFLGKRT
jgi:hypothetical protein